MRRTILASLRTHFGRLVAACVAIVIGVGFATSALVVRASAAHGVDQLIGARYDGVDAVVGRRGRSIDAHDVAAIRRLPQVATVDAISTAYLRTTWPGDVRPSYMQVQAGVPDVRISHGRLPSSATEIALPSHLAEKHQIAVGSKLTLDSGSGRLVTVTVVGTVDDSRSIGGASAVVVPAWKSFAGFDELRIAASGVTPEQLVASVNKSVRPGLRVLTSQAWIDEEVRGYTGGIDVLGAVFGMFAAIALFVAALVIANTFTILLAQRTREMALLRCVGASRRQVFTSVLAEASVVGVVAAGLGVATGIGLSAAGLELAGRFDWGIPPVSLYADSLSIGLPAVLGIAATVLAAVVPARRATKVAPLAALRPEAAVTPASKAGVVRLVLGFLLLAGGGLLLVEGAAGHQVLVGVAGGMISFLGVLTVGAVLVPTLIRIAGLPARGGGVPAQIAVGNAVRNPRRTAATTSALLIGVTLISLTCVGIASVRTTFDRALDAEYPIDLKVSSGNQPMPSSAERQLREIDGIAAVVPVRGTVASNGVTVTGVDPDAARGVARGDALAALKPGTALASPGVLPGSRVTLTAGGRSIRVRAVSAQGIDGVLLTATDMRGLAPDAPVTGFWLDADPRADGAEVIDAVEQSVPSIRELSVSGGLAERTAYTKVFDVLLAVAVGLLAVSVLIALVGVGNTLSLSVLERTRENALLRALGLTRRQLRGMLAVEAPLMALVAAGLGIALGIVYGWAGTAALMGGEIDAISYTIPVTLLATIALVATAAGLLASVLPARRAARVPPAAALATE